MRGPLLRSLASTARVALALSLSACGSGEPDAATPPTENGEGDGTSGIGGDVATTPGGATLDCGGHGCGVKQIALGTIAACALLEDATVACYGGGIVGTLGRGNGERPDIDPVPKRVPNLKNVTKVFGGGYSMCALHEDRTASCWGPEQSENPYGARPGELFAVEGLANVVDLAVATSHTCALVDGGDVYCFGSNYFGELGDGTTSNSKKAVKASALGGARAVATGGEVSCAVLANGDVSCWGMNDLGQLGQGTTDKLVHDAPTVVPGLGGPARAVAASSASGAVCALLESGATRCWGEAIAGEAAATAGSALAVGWSHACTLDGAGAITCWGSNKKGQLGDGSIRGAISLSAGGNSSCAVFGDGAFACWGDDSRGQLGGGKAGTTRAVPQRTHF